MSAVLFWCSFNTVTSFSQRLRNPWNSFIQEKVKCFHTVTTINNSALVDVACAIPSQNEISAYCFWRCHDISVRNSVAYRPVTFSSEMTEALQKGNGQRHRFCWILHVYNSLSLFLLMVLSLIGKLSKIQSASG